MHERNRIYQTTKLKTPAFFIFCLLFGVTGLCDSADSGADLTELSIENLMEQKVTSVSKTEQAFSDTAAAVFVISQDDLRRSGVTNIPEALRMVPGVQVARVDSNKWAISARGFNGRFSNKLLVLIDGRTIYTPTFSGVYWDTQDLLLEDIERIEVIRGPGASVWGANAVNGIINIITIHSEDTHGALVSLTAGNEEKAIAGVRFGGELGDQGHFRVYGKHLQRDGLVDQQGRNARDNWDLTRGGFRVDWTPSASDTVKIQGDIYDGNIGQNYIVPSLSTSTGGRRVLDSGDAYGGSLVARWEHTPSLASRASAQFYYERFRRSDTFQNETRDTFDFDFQHEFALTKDQEFVWGLGYRLSSDHINDAELVSVSPKERDLHLFSAFLQDRISLFDNNLDVTFGTKLEYHTFGGWQYQPNVRAIWKPNSNHRLWVSVSKATRTPSRGERDGEIRILGLPDIQRTVALKGSSNVELEKVLTYEAGYRTWPTANLYFDVAAFYNDYDDLRFTVLGQPTDTTIPLNIVNGERASTWGVELTANWRPIEWSRWQLTYTFLDTDFKVKEPVFAQSGIGFLLGDERDPKHQVSLRSSFDLGPNVELDLWLRYVDRISDITVINPESLPEVDDYISFDARIGWRPFPNIELSLVGRNLNDAKHIEYLQEIATFPTQVQRSIYGQIKWEF